MHDVLVPACQVTTDVLVPACQVTPASVASSLLGECVFSADI